MISAGRELQSGYATAVQLRLRHADGTFRWCKVALTPVQAPDSTLRAIGVISDIQDFRERAEKLAEEVRIDAFTGLYHKSISNWPKPSSGTIRRSATGCSCSTWTTSRNITAPTASCGATVCCALSPHSCGPHCGRRTSSAALAAMSLSS